jgi:cyclase
LTFIAIHSLVIEVDGSIHYNKEVKINDEQRQLLLEKDGLLVIRFRNEEVIKCFELVQKTIEDLILKE